jgi:hypothetical protein
MDKIIAGGGEEYVALQTLEVGTRVRLNGDIIAVVEENPRDGMWIVVRHIVDAQGPISNADPQMVMADDVLGLA